MDVKTENDISRARSIVDEGGIDILFLDVGMPEADGFTFLGFLHEVPATVMCSGQEIAGTAAFDNDVVDCISKLASRKRVKRAVDKAIKSFHEREEEKQHSRTLIRLRRVYQNKWVEVDWRRIEYVSILDDILTIYDVDKQEEKYYITLRGFVEKVPPTEFVQIHRQFVVKISAIRNKEGKALVLTSWAKPPIGDKYAKDVQRVLEQLQS